MRDQRTPWFDELLRAANVAARGNSAESVDDLIQLCAHFGMREESLRADVRALLIERLAMWLLGEPALCLNYLERREVVERRLRDISPSAQNPTAEFRELVEVITQAQARLVAATEMDKDGIGGLAEPALIALLENQGFRCDICGVPFRQNVARATQRFASGCEPVFSMELDHFVPFYFGANDFVRLLCKPCNQLKADRLGVQEDGPVICSNHLRPRDRDSVQRRMMFWALSHSSKCTATECVSTSKSSTLLVAPRGRTAPLTYSNMAPYCIDHAPEYSYWVHSSANLEQASYLRE